MLKQGELSLARRSPFFHIKEKGIMKTKRIEAALFVYEELLTGNKVKKSEVIDVLEISPATYSRLISDIRCYLIDYQKDKELVYNKKEGFYQIKEVQLP
jgi:hypothetical protein